MRTEGFCPESMPGGQEVVSGPDDACWGPAGPMGRGDVELEEIIEVVPVLLNGPMARSEDKQDEKTGVIHSRFGERAIAKRRTATPRCAITRTRIEWSGMI